MSVCQPVFMSVCMYVVLLLAKMWKQNFYLFLFYRWRTNVAVAATKVKVWKDGQLTRHINPSTTPKKKNTNNPGERKRFAKEDILFIKHLFFFYLGQTYLLNSKPKLFFTNVIVYKNVYLVAIKREFKKHLFFFI